jgi:hypothetical protein
MFSQNMNAINNPYGYNHITPYVASPPYHVVNTAPAGGKTLLVIAGIIAVSILCGMGLGLGLGISAAGIISNSTLINVTNSTS